MCDAQCRVVAMLNAKPESGGTGGGEAALEDPGVVQGLTGTQGRAATDGVAVDQSPTASARCEVDEDDAVRVNARDASGEGGGGEGGGRGRAV